MQMSARLLLLCAALQLAIKFVPTRAAFLVSLQVQEQDLGQQVNALAAAFGPMLQDVHNFMVS